MRETTTEHIAAARRAAGREWTFGPEGAVEIERNPILGEMVGAGLIKPHYVSPHRQLAGQDDYYRLTEAGEEWLAAKEAALGEDVT
jgi:hypothetical protein